MSRLFGRNLVGQVFSQDSPNLWTKLDLFAQVALATPLFYFSSFDEEIGKLSDGIYLTVLPCARREEGGVKT